VQGGRENRVVWEVKSGELSGEGKTVGGMPKYDHHG